MISEATPSPIDLPFDQPDMAVRVALNMIARDGWLSAGEMIAMAFTDDAKRREYFRKLDEEIKARGIVLRSPMDRDREKIEARIKYLERIQHGLPGAGNIT